MVVLVMVVLVGVELKALGAALPNADPVAG